MAFEFDGVKETVRTFKDTNAYWIDPKGDVIEVRDTHVDTALKNKKRFSISSDEASLGRHDGEVVILMRNCLQIQIGMCCYGV